MSNKKIVTTAIAYANGAPHIGHAFEFVMADTVVRNLKRQEEDIFFVTGMDEHGQKIQEKAKEKGVPVSSFVEEYAQAFQKLDEELAVSYDFFVRTSDKEKHYKGAQFLWNRLAAKGDIEKRVYKALYCVGCEEFKTEKDLNEKGECPQHLRIPDTVEEENYFFKLSRYGDEIRKRIINNELQIMPESRKNEIIALLDRGLEDVSFSRPISKVSWGIPVPGDDSQVMYVWCDALSNYITALGYGTASFDEERWGNATHVIGKDILRFHAAIWPGMLLSAELALPKRILVHGHITSGGQKMSKSLGNVINPEEVIAMFTSVAQYPGEILRFILLHEIPSFDDGDLTMQSIKQAYTSHCVKGLGNLVSRVCTMVTKYNVEMSSTQTGRSLAKESAIYELVDASQIKNALELLMEWSRELDLRIATEEPFKLFKTDEEKAKKIVAEIHTELCVLSRVMQMFMPQIGKQMEMYLQNPGTIEPLFKQLPVVSL
jgi:methionyl-tRNA synthetase